MKKMNRIKEYLDIESLKLEQELNLKKYKLDHKVKLIESELDRKNANNGLKIGSLTLLSLSTIIGVFFGVQGLLIVGLLLTVLFIIIIYFIGDDDNINNIDL